MVARDFPLAGSDADAQVRLREIISFFVRHAKTTALVAIAVMVIAGIGLFFVTPRYSATAQILLDPNRAEVLGSESVVSNLALDSAAVDSQVAVLSSTSLLRRVVESRNLTQDPEFGQPKPGPFGGLRGMLSAGDSSAPLAQTDIPAAELIAINRLRQELTVRREGRSYVIGLTVSSISPAKAASVANAVAEAFIDDQQEVSNDAAKRASQWLNDRIDGLRAALIDSENAVERFRIDHNLLATETGTLTAQQLTELNAQLVSVRAEAAEKRAKYEQVLAIRQQGGDLDALPDVIQSSVISALRAQYSQVASREADLLSHYGPRHPEVVKVSAERRGVEQQIDAEIARIADNLRNELEVVESRQKSLEQSLANVTGQTGIDNQVTVRLRELERVASANKTLYESFLSRSKIAEEQSTSSAASARMISSASVPASPSFPPKKLVLAGSLVIGLAFGMALGMVLDRMQIGFVTPRQIEESLSLPVLSFLPLLTDVDLLRNGMQLSPAQYLMKNPLTHYSEAIRTLWGAIQLSGGKTNPQVLQVMSVLPKDGKTTVASSIAISLASSGHRVLLIDADLRHPGVSRLFNLENNHGLMDLIAATDGGQADLNFYREKQSGLEVLPAGSKTENPPALLGSDNMKELMDYFRKHYEFIIIDTPPVGPVIDAALLAPLADRILLVVKWGSTPREAVIEAVEHLQERERIAGVALSMADEQRMSLYAGGAPFGGARYKQYYMQSSNGP